MDWRALIAAARSGSSAVVLYSSDSGGASLLQIIYIRGVGLTIVINFDPSPAHIAPGLTGHIDHVRRLFFGRRGGGCLEIEIKLSRFAQLRADVVDRSLDLAADEQSHAISDLAGETGAGVVSLGIAFYDLGKIRKSLPLIGFDGLDANVSAVERFSVGIFNRAFERGRRGIGSGCDQN